MDLFSIIQLNKEFLYDLTQADLFERIYFSAPKIKVLISRFNF